MKTKLQHLPANISKHKPRISVPRRNHVKISPLHVPIQIISALYSLERNSAEVIGQPLEASSAAFEKDRKNGGANPKEAKESRADRILLL